MYINITVPARLYLLRRHKELLIQLLIQLIKNKAPLGGNQRRIRVGILLVSNVHNGLAFLIYVVQHTHKILFIIPIIAITLCHNGLYLL